MDKKNWIIWGPLKRFIYRSRGRRESRITNDQKEGPMKLQKIIFTVSMVFLLGSAAVATAGDFDWIKSLNIRADADRSGFRTRLATRFNIDGAQVNAVFSSVERPADAYMLFRLREMSARPMDHVIRKYRSKKVKGWGALAKSLGIKPGSREFHALKRGSSFYNESHEYKGKGKGKIRGKGKDRRGRGRR